MRTSACFSCSAVALLALLATGCHPSHSSSMEYPLDSGQPITGTEGSALSINKMGGDIVIADAPGGAYLRTMGGAITVDKVSKSLDATSMGGNVTIRSANVGTLKAETMGGNIDITSAQATDLHASTSGGNVSVQTLADGSISLKSLGGAITLTIPKSSSAQIDIELAYTMNNNGKYAVTDDLNLPQQQTSSWDFSHGNPRKYIHAKGVIGSGKNHITIKTVDGNITLKTQ